MKKQTTKKMQTQQVTKLWDLYYNGAKVKNAQGVHYGVIAKVKKDLISAKTHSDSRFQIKFHGL